MADGLGHILLAHAVLLCLGERSGVVADARGAHDGCSLCGARPDVLVHLWRGTKAFAEPLILGSQAARAARWAAFCPLTSG